MRCVEVDKAGSSCKQARRTVSRVCRPLRVRSPCSCITAEHQDSVFLFFFIIVATDPEPFKLVAMRRR